MIINIEHDKSTINNEWLDAMTEWVNYKRESNSKYTISGLKKIINQWLSKSSEELQSAVDSSIGNNYKGLFPAKGGFNKTTGMYDPKNNRVFDDKPFVNKITRDAELALENDTSVKPF